MECIVDFLHDSYQEKLRNLAQVKSEKYEEALENYRDTFISELMLIRSNTGFCDKHINLDYAKGILDFVKEIPLIEIEEFFNAIVEIYINWIDTQGEDALTKFENLMKKYKLLDFKYDLSSDILFRGRFSDDILTQWDMFHIPFNKRYLISNQRYSLTGQPLLYLGFSVLDILAELNGNFEDFHNLKVSTYKIKDRFTIYDLRNEFYKYLSYNPLKNMISDADDSNNLEIEQLKKEFFKFILASICSFEKRKEHMGYSFCEEYVIPQILAQIIKKNSFKGIIYSSTRLKNKENDENYNTTYKDNVAIFTKLCRDHIYDRELFDKFIICTPVSLSKIKNITLEDIKYICDKIKILDNNKKYKDYYLTGVRLQDNFSKIKIGDCNYLEHDIGRMHLYLIYNLLVDVRNGCLIKGGIQNG